MATNPQIPGNLRNTAARPSRARTRQRQTAGGRGIGAAATRARNLASSSVASLAGRATYGDGFADGVEHMRKLFHKR
jgi:hypothetical protein